MSTVAEDLRQAAQLFEERNAQYGDAYIVVGKVLHELFPKGIALNSPEDHARMHLLGWTVGKLTRYAANFSKGGHEDSLKDASVYTAMLRNLDMKIEERENNEIPY